MRIYIFSMMKKQKYPGIVICHYNDTRKMIYEELKTKYNKVETISDNEILYNKDNEWVKI